MRYCSNLVDNRHYGAFNLPGRSKSSAENVRSTLSGIPLDEEAYAMDALASALDTLRPAVALSPSTSITIPTMPESDGHVSCPGSGAATMLRLDQEYGACRSSKDECYADLI